MPIVTESDHGNTQLQLQGLVRGELLDGRVLPVLLRHLVVAIGVVARPDLYISTVCMYMRDTFMYGFMSVA